MIEKRGFKIQKNIFKNLDQKREEDYIAKYLSRHFSNDRERFDFATLSLRLMSQNLCCATYIIVIHKGLKALPSSKLDENFNFCYFTV